MVRRDIGVSASSGRDSARDLEGCWPVFRLMGPPMSPKGATRLHLRMPHDEVLWRQAPKSSFWLVRSHQRSSFLPAIEG